MRGTEWTDNVCVTSLACLNDFEFFLVTDQEGLKEPVDGIMGLARNKPFYLSSEKGLSRGPSYMMGLVNAGLISTNAFSFYMAPYGNRSWIDFGEPKIESMRDSEDVAFIELNEDFFWSANCGGFALNGIENGYRWGSRKNAGKTVSSGAVYSIFDTGASAIIFPKEYFKNFLKKLYSEIDGDEYEVASGYVVTKCYEDFPTIQFLLGSKWVTIDADEYVVDISDNQDRSICVLLLSQGDADFFVMGLPLFMDYYTVHDDTNGQIGFVPHSTSTKSPI